ncbi:MAG: hypothetical protein D6B25_12620 [Desulfobulbaceae bacterium]|nr:MAG: hypothetical protein D6B25_12620 [Desulfobulbaceae bacterium]
MKFLNIFIALLLFTSFAHAENLVPRNALNGKVSLLTPENFGPMPQDILELKYPSSRRPTEVLSDTTGGVTLAFNHTKNQMTPHQIKEAHASISQMFHNLYPSAQWLRDETITQNGQVFMVLELITPAIDTQIHNIMYGTSVDNRLLLVSFNTTIEQSAHWLPVGNKIMESLTIK